jgi:sugar fermentation stimulation protein A
MLYVINRTDDLPFRLAKEIDQKYYELFKEVTKNGVEVLVYHSAIKLNDKDGDIFIDHLADL